MKQAAIALTVLLIISAAAFGVSVAVEGFYSGVNVETADITTVIMATQKPERPDRTEIYGDDIIWYTAESNFSEEMSELRERIAESEFYDKTDDLYEFIEKIYSPNEAIDENMYGETTSVAVYIYEPDSTTVYENG